MGVPNLFLAPRAPSNLVTPLCIAEAGNDDITIVPNNVASWPKPTNHDIRVELVKARPERYRNKGPF